MTQKQFSSASMEQQKRFVRSNGAYLMLRKCKGVPVYLFQVDGFYVEVFFDPATSRELCLRSFDDLQRLDIYLKRISLKELLPLLETNRDNEREKDAFSDDD